MKSNVIDFSDPNANMYGCQPCPMCRDKHRASYKRGGVLQIDCDDCGFVEPAERADDD